jgi:beta-glucosidase
MKCADDSGFAAAVVAAKAADVVILALGIDGDICGEGKDRMDITLPGKQHDLAKAVIAAGKPTVVLIFSGGLIDVADLKEADIAIVQGWFPGATGGAPASPF